MTDQETWVHTAGTAVGTDVVVRQPGEVVARPGTHHDEAETWYDSVLDRVDQTRVALSDARERLDRARAELASAEERYREVDATAARLWTSLRTSLGRAGRALPAVPDIDPDPPPNVDLDGLLREVETDVGGGAERKPRLPRALIMPLSGALAGAVGFLVAMAWVRSVGMNVIGALAVIAVLGAPVLGAALGQWWRGRRDKRQIEPEPVPAFVAIVVAAATELVLYAVVI